MTGKLTPMRMYEPERDEWLDVPHPEKSDVRVRFAQELVTGRRRLERLAPCGPIEILQCSDRQILPATYTAVGQEVLCGREHIADARDVETARRIARALSLVGQE